MGRQDLPQLRTRGEVGLGSLSQRTMRKRWWTRSSVTSQCIMDCNMHASSGKRRLASSRRTTRDPRPVTPSMKTWSPKAKGLGTVRRPPQDRRLEEWVPTPQGTVDLPPLKGRKLPNLHQTLRRNSKSPRTKVLSLRPLTRSSPWRMTTTSALSVVQVVIPTMIVLKKVPMQLRLHWWIWGKDFRAMMSKKEKLPKGMMKRSRSSAKRTTRRHGLESICISRQSHYRSLVTEPMERRASTESKLTRWALRPKARWTMLSIQQARGASLWHAKKWDQLCRTPKTGCIENSPSAPTLGSWRFSPWTEASSTPSATWDLGWSFHCHPRTTPIKCSWNHGRRPTVTTSTRPWGTMSGEEKCGRKPSEVEGQHILDWDVTKPDGWTSWTFSTIHGSSSMRMSAQRMMVSLMWTSAQNASTPWSRPFGRSSKKRTRSASNFCALSWTPHSTSLMNTSRRSWESAMTFTTSSQRVAKSSSHQSQYDRPEDFQPVDKTSALTTTRFVTRSRLRLQMTSLSAIMSLSSRMWSASSKKVYDLVAIEEDELKFSSIHLYHGTSDTRRSWEDNWHT